MSFTYVSLSIAARPPIASALADPASVAPIERVYAVGQLERRSKTLYAQAGVMATKNNPLLANTIVHTRERAMELANQAESLRQYQEK